MSKELTPYMQKAAGLREYLNGDSIKSTLAAALPQWLSVDRLLRIVFSSATRNPKLLDCTRESILQSVMMCAQLGLEPILGRAYLIPYNNNKQIGGRWQKVLECQFQPGYQGLVDLARRSNTIKDVYAFNVHENDDFDLSYGTDRSIHHVPWFMDPKKKQAGPGQFFGSYAVWLLKDGTMHPEFMHATDIFKRRDRSQAYQYAKNNPQNKSAQDCPWIQWPEEMQTKTVIKHSSKMVPASIEFMQAVELDNQAEIGASQTGFSMDFGALPEITDNTTPDPVNASDRFRGMEQTAIRAAGFDGEIERRTGERPSPDMESFIERLAAGQDMTVDEVKQQIAAENDYENFMAHFEKFEAEQAAASNHVEKPETGKSTVKVGAEDLGDLSDPTTHDKWYKLKRGTPAKGTGFAAYVKKHEAAFAEAWPEWGQDLRNEFMEKHHAFYGMPPAFIAAEQPDDDQSQEADDSAGGQDEPDIDTMDRFNDIFISARDTPAWHYAQGAVTGDENNSFRPKTEQIKTWLIYYDEYTKNMAEPF